MLLPGICPHCGTYNRFVDEWDAFAHGRRRYCMVCGFTLYWLNRNGTRYEPPTWEEDEMAHIELRTDGAALVGRQAGRLTEGEREMLRLAALGMTNQEIATTSGRKHKTVKNLLSLAFTKLGASNRGEAVTIAVRSGVIPCPYCQRN